MQTKNQKKIKQSAKGAIARHEYRSFIPLKKEYIRDHNWFSLYIHFLLIFIIYSLSMKIRIQKEIEKSIRMEYFEIGVDPKKLYFFILFFIL